MGWLLLPVMLGLTFLLVGIENIGVQVRRPHGPWLHGRAAPPLSNASHFFSPNQLPPHHQHTPSD
jgi:hypothetical protein